MRGVVQECRCNPPVSTRPADPNAQLRASIISLSLGLVGLLGGGPLYATPADAGSLSFVENAPNEHDYARLLDLPSSFGQGEFTLEIWIRPDASYPVGPIVENTPDQLIRWSTSDEAPYSSPSWWYRGNFLLDGHNNNAFEQGTFSLQMYAGGRVRWLFGDGTYAGEGGHFAVEAHPGDTTQSLLDGDWHLVTLVRRWTGSSGARLELWVDGSAVAIESTPVRTDMRTFWESWNGFPASGRGWYLGSEKQAAVGSLSQYEDYKGLVAGLRFWSVARGPVAIGRSPDTQLTGSELGLVGWYRFDEGAGSTTCDALAPTDCMELVSTPAPWSTGSPTPVVPVPIAGWAALGLAMLLGQTGRLAATPRRQPIGRA